MEFNSILNYTVQLSLICTVIRDLIYRVHIYRLKSE